MTQKLWSPSAARIGNSRAHEFMSRYPLSCTPATATPEERWHSLYEYSITHPQDFWRSVFEFSNIIASGSAEEVIRNPDAMPGAEWFPDLKLNFAENLLSRQDDHPAIIAWGEDSYRRTISYRELYDHVLGLAATLQNLGVGPCDRVAGLMPNIPDTVIAMLATTALGATWSSCSPDFGVSGVLDRFGQISPKVLFCADGYCFKGAVVDCRQKNSEIAGGLPSLAACVVSSYTGRGTVDTAAAAHISFDAAIKGSGGNAAKPGFSRLPFSHPLYIMYSSGTTGKPKCIVHGSGGTLLEHKKELLLHVNVQPHDRVFYQTTCGWMMWNWLMSALSVGASVVLYDGAPFHRSGRVLFDLARDEEVTIFGTNAKYIALCQKEGLRPRESHDMPSVHTILSTGSPLAAESFDYVYRDWAADACLSSISGGTDILGCFALGSPLLPVYRGELQTRSLGLKVEVFNEDARSVQGEKGELVCTAPFPSMPVGFWHDPDGTKYRSAYFSRYPGIWHHGDYVELTPRGGMIFYGRSDAVLNPGGVRIGTAEIYAQVETIAEVLESVAVGQEWQGDVRVILFVKLQPGVRLTPQLEETIRSTIRRNASPFHVPKIIRAVPDIPRTRSGKIVELAIRDVLHGREVKNCEALANPEALQYFTETLS